jgi:hypothetical protein
MNPATAAAANSVTQNNFKKSGAGMRMTTASLPRSDFFFVT